MMKKKCTLLKFFLFHSDKCLQNANSLCFPWFVKLGSVSNKYNKKIIGCAFLH